MRPWLAFLGCACTAHAHVTPLQLRSVVLYQNGIGYFERSGRLVGGRLDLSLARGDLDDVLKTLTVIDRLGAGVATVDVPTLRASDRTLTLGVRMATGGVRDLHVGYAVPTPTWKSAYRVVIDDRTSLLQGWAMVDNTSQEDWSGITLTLATGAPMSLALDLHTPEYVSRPDTGGHLVAPTTTGVVDPEVAGAADRDGDGIPDAMDKCPDEPETVNGFEDADGCPEHAQVVVTDSSLTVLDRIYFAKGSDAIAGVSDPILETIATALRKNPSIRRVEIGGHASADEDDPWGVSARRAAAVRAALIARGIAAARLVVVPYGSTRPLSAPTAAHDTDRRVEFEILQRDEDAPASALAPRYDTRTAETAVHAATQPVSVAGAVRYVLSEPVSIRRGAAAMVSILNKRVSADDVLLFRPDRNAPGSDRHPFRAVRLVNDSGFTLEPGPIAIFAHGSFVGDSLIKRLELGETAWVPYALEGGTTVTVVRDDDERPMRIVSIRRGVIEVEDVAVRTTRYTIAAGRDASGLLYLRHGKTAGYTPRDLPPSSIDQGDAYLIPMPLHPGKTSVLAVEEPSPKHKTLQLADAPSKELALYVTGSHLSDALAGQLRAAIALREEIGAGDDKRAALRERLGELAARAQDLRENLKAIDRVRGTDELRKHLVADLAQTTSDADTVARDLALANDAVAVRRAKLQDALRDITMEP